MPQQFPLVYCVILTMNARDVLLETLDSVYKMTYPNFKVLVVDNGSIDGTPEILRGKYKWVSVIENGENLGVTGGRNVGMKYALEHGADWVYHLDNDVIVDPNLLTELMNVAVRDENIGIMGAKIYYYSQPNILWYAGGRINYFNGLVSHRGKGKLDKGQYDKIEDVRFVVGCSFLIKKAVLERVGLFDPVYNPFYAEDTDMCARAIRAGFRIVYVPTAKLWHRVSTSSGGVVTPKRMTLKIEKNLIFFKRYAKWYHWMTIPWCIGTVAIGFLVLSIIRGNFKVLFAVFRGFLKAIKRLIS